MNALKVLSDTNNSDYLRITQIVRYFCGNFTQHFTSKLFPTLLPSEGDSGVRLYCL